MGIKALTGSVIGNNFNILHGVIDFYLELFVICPWNMSCDIGNAFIDMHYNVVTPIIVLPVM